MTCLPIPGCGHRRGRRGSVSLNRSPLARKIIIFNMLALVILVAGVLFMNPFRDSLVLQREQGLVSEARLIADVFEARLACGARCGTRAGAPVPKPLGVTDWPGVEVFVFDRRGAAGMASDPPRRAGRPNGRP
jgi:two-component system, OmpR family, sensor histidine kinase ChvG